MTPRPLARDCGSFTAYYTHDGNKNVSEAVAENGDITAHYAYAPFGALIARRGASAAVNPWRFSSEYAEDDTATVYYNYRHYEPVMGRWLSMDCLFRSNVSVVACRLYGQENLFLYVDNSPCEIFDVLGMINYLCFCGSSEAPAGEWSSAVKDGKRCAMESHGMVIKVVMHFDCNPSLPFLDCNHKYCANRECDLTTEYRREVVDGKRGKLFAWVVQTSRMSDFHSK